MFRHFAFALLVTIPTVASAQSVEILGPPPPSTPEVFAKDERGHITIRATRATIDLDGNLDENIYETVPPIDHFVQQEPNEGASATEKTQAWLFYDDNNFYVAVRNYDSQPDRLVANELRRDNFNISRTTTSPSASTRSTPAGAPCSSR